MSTHRRPLVALIAVSISMPALGQRIEVALSHQASQHADRPCQGSTNTSSTGRFPRNAEEFGRLFEETKNWGRWGPADQLGAANSITDEKRKQALALARVGRVVGLAHPLLKEPAPDNPAPFEQTMSLGIADAA